MRVNPKNKSTQNILNFHWCRNGKFIIGGYRKNKIYLGTLYSIHSQSLKPQIYVLTKDIGIYISLQKKKKALRFIRKIQVRRFATPRISKIIHL